jgi:prefoldin subunit 5
MAKPMDAAASVASVASASKIGELFQYTVGSVSLPRQRSAMIPIITDPIEVEKLSIYNQNVLPKNPLNGARIKNTTQKHLLQGPITVLDGNTYAGDARIDNVPPGQERLLSYGIDLQMLVNATRNKQESAIQTGKIVKGVLHLKRKHLFTQEYVAQNKDEKDKTLIIEHPLRQSWTLVDTPKPIETTEALYRFKQVVPAGKQAALTVKQENIAGEIIAILPADFATLDFYGKSGEIPKDVREALTKAARLKQQLVDLQRQVDQRKAEINQITQDQSRIRENIKTVPDKSTLKNRLLEKLEEQEKQIDDIYKRMDDTQKALEKSRQELEDYLRDLTIGE